MKRFYREVAVAEAGGGFAIELDGKRVRTPRRLAFTVPYRPLAEAVAEEWRRQGDAVDVRSMRLTGFANAALDLVAARRAEVVRQVAAYAETDLVCYRASEPEALIRRQSAAWDSLIAWLAERHGVRLNVTAGIVPCRQDAAALDAVRAAVAAFDSFVLTALRMTTAACGSITIGLALAAGRIDAGEAFTAAFVDEFHQAERWGEDTEAARRRAAIRADLEAAASFFALCQGRSA